MNQQSEDVFVVDKPYQMICGAEEAAKFVYRSAEDKKGRIWLYPINTDAPGEQVHVHDPKDKNSDGYGGSTLHFLLEDGSYYDAKGPWHSNTEALFKETGIDLRATHYTYGCVARKRVYLPLRQGISLNSTHQRFEGVLYADKKPVLGEFDRLKKIAIEWANKLGHPVACYSSSKGGSSSGWEIPSGTNWKDWQKWFEENK